MRPLAVLGLALTLLAVAAPVRAEVVTIASVPGSSLTPSLIARDLGYFSKRGLDANPITIALIPTIVPAIMAGSVQIGLSTGPVLFQAVANGLDLVAVAGWDRSTQQHATFSLLALPDSGLRRAEDLRGKRVAIPGLQSLVDLSFRRWLLMHGVRFDEIVPVEQSFPPMLDMMRGHQIDAALMIDPFRANALANHSAVLVADYPKELVGEMIASLWVAERRWAEAHMADIRAFRAGVAEGFAAWQRDPAAKAVELKYTKGNVADISLVSPDITLGDLQFLYDLTKQFGLVEGSLDLQRLLLPQ